MKERKYEIQVIRLQAFMILETQGYNVTELQYCRAQSYRAAVQNASRLKEYRFTVFW
jgi:hypothetical protein